jgi:hypothetical protein
LLTQGNRHAVVAHQTIGIGISNPTVDNSQVRLTIQNKQVPQGRTININKTIGQADPNTQVANLLTGKPQNKHITSSTKESQQTNE